MKTLAEICDAHACELWTGSPCPYINWVFVENGAERQPVVIVEPGAQHGYTVDISNKNRYWFPRAAIRCVKYYPPSYLPFGLGNGWVDGLLAALKRRAEKEGRITVFGCVEDLCSVRQNGYIARVCVAVAAWHPDRGRGPHVIATSRS